MGKVADLINSGDTKKLGELINFCAKEFSMENLAFLLAVNQYRAVHPGKNRGTGKKFVVHPELWKQGLAAPQSTWAGANTMGGWIYNTFVTQAAKAQINISSRVKTDLDAIGTAPGTPFIPPSYDAAYNEIEALVNNDTWNRFAGSR